MTAAAAMTAGPGPLLTPGLWYLWLVPGLPLLAFVVIALVTRPWRLVSAGVAIAAIAGAAVLGWIAFLDQLGAGPAARSPEPIVWFQTGTLAPVIGISLDALSAMMLVVVTTVALMVQVYSLGYMAEEASLARFYAYLSLFCASMLSLVLATNFLQIYISWELVGVCSYLLIGFWYDRHAPAFAAKKAFVTTRLGDLGFLIGLIMLCSKAGTYDFAAIKAQVAAGHFDQGWLAVVAVLLFCGAVGKSAQVPLHFWLPDAMEGPTPVSALIHAATMVAAGVYLVARSFYLFEAAPQALHTVAIIGGITAIFAASIALVQDDIKRVLAYSTISQLGYMMLGLGVGSVTAGMYHLFTHAFFKALLFLGAGSVIHATHTNNMWEMGGLRKKMPWTFATFAIGSLALAGFFPFSGFFSKDLILHHALHEQPALFGLAVLGAFCTAFYMGRAVFVTFFGEPRGHGHAHESPWVMVAPLLILAALSLYPPLRMTQFASFVYGGASPEEVEPLSAFGFMMLSVPVAGLVLSLAMYVYRVPDPDAMVRVAGPVYRLLRHRYYVDEIVDFIINRIVMNISAALAWFDRHVVDGSVDGVAWLAVRTGRLLRRIQTGRVQDYALVLFGGMVVLLLLARMAGAR